MATGIKPREITEEVQQSYLEYAMSVIVARALPDVRDGLKPVHRRILYSMQEMGLRHSAKYQKSAKIVGHAMGNYHPHGDSAIYDSLARMAQDFSLRYPLVDGQGNFGCFTKDTKVKLTDSRSLSFGELIEEQKDGKKHFTYTINSLGLIAIAEIKNPRLTRENAEIIKVTLDNGKEIRCTPNHRFLQKNLEYREAQRLTPNDSLMPFYSKLSEKTDRLNREGYVLIYQPVTDAWVPVHHLADNFNLTHKKYNISNGRVRHHVDFNKLNNDPSNIRRMQWGEHWQIHYSQATNQHKNLEYREKIIKGNKNHTTNKTGKFKFLNIAKTAIKRFSLLNAENYEKVRLEVYPYGAAPLWETGVQKYFSGDSNLVRQEINRNHRIVYIEKGGHEDVYDLTIEGTHNFALDAGVFVHNSIDGDNPAAMRYTEARLDPIADQLLADIDKDTVNFRDNYDGSHQEPVVLPTRVPNLLINGSMGIAVGMATNIPPHNLSEVLAAMMHLIDTPDADLKDLMQFVKGPDFPTGATIYNEQDIINAYATGRGPVVMRGKAEIVESAKKGFQIIISEIPYQVNKSELIIKIADLVKEKKIDGIKDLRDESDKDGMRIAVDLKQDAFPRKVLNQLFKYTELQKSFHFNMLALVDGIQPQTMGLKSLLEKFIDHRKEVIIRRSKFELQKAKDRAHILEGLKIALDHIDEVIKIIRASASKEDAAVNLMKKFKLSDKQAAAILDMRLQALAGLERKKVEEELAEKLKLIVYFEDLLKSPKKILGVVKTEFKEIQEKYGDERRTKVVKSVLREIGEEELIPEENSLFMITRDGYVKRMAPDILKTQKRGGKGLMGMATKEEDVISHFFLANTHDSILFFTNSGKVFQTKGYEVPESSRQSKGKAIVNFLQVSPSDVITAIVPIPKGQKQMYLFMATDHGVIKKVDMDAFEAVRRNGLIAIKLNGDDRLGWVLPTSGDDQISMITSGGNAIRFKEKDVRPMGRGASGVIGVRLDKEQRVVGTDVIPSGAEKGLNLLVLMENGYGKRSDLKAYKLQKRGGHGIMTAKLTPKTGKLVSAHITSEEQKEIIAVSLKGQVIRTSIGSISVLGRATQGVRVMRLDAGDKLASVVVA